LLRDLPDGVFVAEERSPGTAFLLRGGGLHPWSHAGYDEPVHMPIDRPVKVLTPAPIIGILKTGRVTLA
jgi:hypothetical protein